MSNWVPLDISQDLRPGEKQVCTAGQQELLICRVGDEYYGLGPRCPHAAWPLIDEPLDAFNLTCTLHGAVFDVRDGCPSAGPTSKSLATFPVEQREGRLYVSLCP